MNHKIRFAAGLFVIVVIAIAMFGLSLKTRATLDETNQRNTLPSPTTGQLVTKVSASDRSAFGPDTQPVPEASKDDKIISLPLRKAMMTQDLALLDSLDFADVRDVKLAGNRALLATAGGVLEFYKEDSSFNIYSYPHGLDAYDSYAILAVGEDILVGTSGGVYRIDGIGIVSHIWKEISDTVSTLKDFDGTIFVGTRNAGLYLIKGDTIDQILSGKFVVAVTKNYKGLWVATKQDGLLFNDENGWHKRYLRRDSTAFAVVNCLETAFAQPWVGTPNGLWAYNGGSWTLIDSTKYLFDQNITTLAMGKNFIYIGTAHSGVFSYYDGGLSPLDWSENLAVSSLDIDNGSYLVGMQKGGAILKTAKGELNILQIVRRECGSSVTGA